MPFPIVKQVPSHQSNYVYYLLKSGGRGNLVNRNYCNAWEMLALVRRCGAQVLWIIKKTFFTNFWCFKVGIDAMHISWRPNTAGCISYATNMSVFSVAFYRQRLLTVFELMKAWPSPGQCMFSYWTRHCALSIVQILLSGNQTFVALIRATIQFTA